MKADYSKMTHDDFTDCLIQLIQDEGITTIIQIQGVYEILSEHFNNEVLDLWAETNPELAYGEEE